MPSRSPVRQDRHRQVEPVPASRARVTTGELEEFLQQRVLSGDWPAGHRLPSEAELGRQFSASRTAVREAIRRLQGCGLLKTVNGSGTYVADGRLEHVSFALNAYSTLAADEISRGVPISEARRACYQSYDDIVPWVTEKMRAGFTAPYNAKDLRDLSVTSIFLMHRKRR